MPQPRPASKIATTSGYGLLVLLLVAASTPGLLFSQASSYLHSDDFENARTACLWNGEPTPWVETFDLDGAAWPAPWQPIGSVETGDVLSGQARFRPSASGYSLARMYAPVDTSDVEVLFTMVFEEIGTQGVGFYVRSSGGYLDQSNPRGQGYAVFVEHFRGQPGIGVWKEIDGQEISLAIDFDDALGFQNQVPYRVRFRVNQVSASTTLLQARIWPLADPEPEQWQVTFLDSTPELQGISGGIALDSWSSRTNPPIDPYNRIDDIEVRPLCNPLRHRQPTVAITESLLFSEGPVWRQDHLLFSDIEADTIYRLDPPTGVNSFRTPSDNANGLDLLPDGRLLAAEHGSRSVTRTETNGDRTTIADLFQGQRFNSPNDVAARSDGTVYFTDPDYGLADPQDRELPWNGLYRISANGTVTLEWQGTTSQKPNGVALSPDQSTLYLSESQAGVVYAFSVAADGSLSTPSTFAQGLTTPDGLCVDRLGNLWVATWAQTVAVFDASGVPWGAIDLPRPATNCAFGGSLDRTLFITALQGLYSVDLSLPGRP